MTVPRPDHLLEQALALATSSSGGRPRQVNLRRSVSSAYYAVFHATAAAAADEVVGRNRQSTLEYVLAYRSIEHRSLRSLCANVSKDSFAPDARRYVPNGGFGSDVTAYAVSLLELQEQRHRADYDPSLTLSVSEVLAAFTAARDAMARFHQAEAALRTRFLTLLLFRARA